MKTRSRLCLVLCGLTMVALLAGPTSAERFHLMLNLDRGKFPGADRTVVPTPFPMAGVPGNFNDGDRLAGTSDVGPDAAWMGLGTPIFGTNQFGALSFLLQRGSVPIPTFGQSPIMEAMLYSRNDVGELTELSLFDTSLPPLINARTPSAFTF